MRSGRLDISLSGILPIKFLVRKNMIFCSVGTSIRGLYDPVQSGLDVTDLVQSRIDVRGSVQNRIDVL